MREVEILKQYFGYTSFRNGQEQLIRNILSGRDVVGIMPTGGGKSLCYQIPALMQNGITLVISPLISLMKDQVQTLVNNGVPAAFINSMLNVNQTAKALFNAGTGKYKIIYVAPERLETADFLEFATNADIFMVAVDEAHCVSQWGQNFRPSYLKIRNFVQKLKVRPVVSAFTATATYKVREDIVEFLRLKDPFEVTTGFNRENLYFEVRKPEDKYLELRRYLNENANKSGVIYCNTRKTVEEVCQKLHREKISVTRYHAGLSEEERTKNQEDFLFDRKMVMVATNAFGMGIDKSNVSFVVHYNMPKDLESYYQEAGRAGRDGASAECILLYGGQDVITNQFLIENTEEKNDLPIEILDQIKEKDRERLKQMTYYCHTFDCLRAYILKYFEEKAPHFCGNCSNCRTNFEETDVLEQARKILACISDLKGRFGIKVVIDTLRGSKAEKIIRLGLNGSKAYGTLADFSEKRLRDIINYLILQEYLMLTNSDYPVVKLAMKAKEILFEKESFMMKIPMEKPQVKPSQSKKALPRTAEPNHGLLLKLKELRLKLAKEQHVPAFVVFSDASLMDMCKRMPSNESEFLEVVGVGNVKMEKYGAAFLQVIGQEVSQ